MREEQILYELDDVLKTTKRIADYRLAHKEYLKIERVRARFLRSDTNMYSRVGFIRHALSPAHWISAILSVLISFGLFWFKVPIETSIPLLDDLYEIHPTSPYVIVGIVVFFVLNGIRYLLALEPIISEALSDRIIGRNERVNVSSSGDRHRPVFDVISDVYDNLQRTRSERKRQAKWSFNVALTLVVCGVSLIFFGVYMLFRQLITSGSITTGVGVVSNILSGTIFKLHKDANNRLDAMDDDIYIIDSVKVSYALILNIEDEKTRNDELSKLIKSIKHIKRPK